MAGKCHTWGCTSRRKEKDYETVNIPFKSRKPKSISIVSGKVKHVARIKQAPLQFYTPCLRELNNVEDVVLCWNSGHFKGKNIVLLCKILSVEGRIKVWLEYNDKW